MYSSCTYLVIRNISTNLPRSFLCSLTAFPAFPLTVSCPSLVWSCLGKISRRLGNHNLNLASRYIFII